MFFFIWVITHKNTKCDGGLNISLKWTVQNNNRVLNMRLLLQKKKKKSWLCLRLNNTQASLCWLHAGNICYSNFATISDYAYWDPVFNADSTGFEVFLLLAFCPTANEQLRDCWQVSGFLRISLWRCPSELGDHRCRSLELFTNPEWASIMWDPLIWSSL